MLEKHLWATSYALTATDLFTKFDYSKLKVPFNTLPGNLGLNSKQLITRIFRYFFYLVIKDIIENKTTFKFPRTFRAFLEMLSVSGEEFIKARQNGKFLDVDFLTSNFTGYHIGLRYNTRYGKWTKVLHVTEKFKNRITELTNVGHGW